MNKSSVRFLVNLPLEAAFAYTIELDRFRSWMNGALGVEGLPKQKLAPNAMFILRHNQNGKILKLNARVMLLTPNEKWSIFATNQDMWIRRTCEFQAHSFGTQIIYTEERPQPNAAFNFLTYFVGKKLQKLVEEGCENLKKMMESSHKVATVRPF